MKTIGYTQKENNMEWSEVKTRYGEKLAKKMRTCPYLKGITVKIKSNGHIDFPESDIYIAWKWATGKKVHEWELD